MATKNPLPVDDKAENLLWIYDLDCLPGIKVYFQLFLSGEITGQIRRKSGINPNESRSNGRDFYLFYELDFVVPAGTVCHLLQWVQRVVISL